MPKIICSILFVFLYIGDGNAECGYQSCHPIKEDHINIHLVPHSHDDLGWLKTVDQYYFGTHEEVFPAGVQYILDTVVEALQNNTDRRFIYVEMGFFFKWWPLQSQETQNIVRNLVNNGRLEFVGGGWSMNDEASTYYQTTIDQMSLGLRRLKETFGECGRPKIGWQIDPFGHSREMASIFAQLGYDGFFLNRIDYEDLEARKLNRSMEFIWRSSPENLGESSDIYTNVLFKHYSSPDGLCFDVLCSYTPVIDDINDPRYNVNNKAENFINQWVQPASEVYASNNVLVPLGNDFTYQKAGIYLDNVDKLVKYMNDRKNFNGINYNVIYSTPSCYLNAVYQSTNGTLEAPLKTDDFFPYAYESNNYWSGYFTSRPTGKGYSRFANNFLQISKQLSALTNVTSSKETELNVLREALGVFQHHDAITGTEKENVAHDYIKMVHNGIVSCEGTTSNILSFLTNSTNTTFTTCHMLNISECATTENEEKLVITVYNPLGRPVNKFVRVPIVDQTSEIFIRDPSGAHVVTQIVPIHPSVVTVPGRNSTAQYDLIFRADDVPALGFKSFFFEKVSGGGYDNYEGFTEHLDTGSHNVQVSTSPSGSKIHVRNKDGLGLSVGTEYYYYSGYIGSYSPSEPYVFRPDPNIPLQPVSQSNSYKVYEGYWVTETHWFYNDWFSYIFRTYRDSSVAGEFNYLVGPLPYHEHGVEVIAKFNTDLEYDDKFYTDTNGREIIERIRNYRPTWNVTITEPEAGNYYPIVSGVTVKNESAEVTVLTDRANGGASLSYQNFEFMIHRNTRQTGGGVAEPLNEQAFGTGVVSRGSHYLLLDGTDFSDSNDLTPKEVSQEIYLDSWLFFASPGDQSFEQYQQTHIMEFSGLANITLPRNVHILSLEPWGPSVLLLRLENFIGKEDKRHSGVSTVNVKELFSTFDVLTMKETTLGGNQWLEENHRIRFNKGTDGRKKIYNDKDDFNVTLDPMEIRTFALTIAYNL